jgi:outer membrane receptor protein involved in Fe transport
MKLYAQNLTNKLYYDTLYRSAVPFVAVAPGRAFYLVTRRSSDRADLRPRGAEQG